jgi:hypothetical protein
VRRHVSAEVLALYREGAVSARKAAGIASHLSGCSQCEGIVGDLVNVSVLLTATSVPPMPDVLAVRIETAIVRESALRAAASPGQEPGTGRELVPGRPDLPERGGHGARRFRMPSWSSPVLLRSLAATGAVAVIAGAGFLLASGQTSPENSAGTSTRGQPAAAPRRSLSNTHAGLPTAGRVPTYVSYHLNGKVVTASAIASQTNFGKASLAAQVRRDVRSSSVAFGGAQRSEPAPTSSSIGGVSLSELAGCLDRVSAGRKVLLANVARYLGRPATIIILKPLTAADIFDVTIVGLSCSASNPEVISRTTVPSS